MRREKDLMLFGLNANQSSFKGVGFFLFVYLGASIFASIFTPPVYWLAEYLNANFKEYLSWFFDTQWLVNKGIENFYDRLRWIPIVIGLPFMMRYCGLFSWKALGISFDKNGLKIFIKYFVLGILLASFLFALQYFFTDVKLRNDFEIKNFYGVILSGLVGALLLGFLEEIIFRGLLFRSCYTAFGVSWGVVLPSLFFAYKHYKPDGNVWKQSGIDMLIAKWYSGFEICYFDTVAIAYTFNPLSFFVYLSLGISFTLFYMITKSLLSSIGFHAGIIYTIFLYRALFTVGETPLKKVFGTTGLTDGHTSLICLCLIILIQVYILTRKKDDIV